jgi:predicted DNA-binding transcriptional regulator AlpA
MRRFLALQLADQLRAYEQMREYLSAAARETKADRELRDRIEALDAIRKVADHLGLPEQKAPTADQFNEHAPAVAPGWNVSKVGRAWGSWRFACDVHRGERPRLSARQRGLQAKVSGRTRTREEHLTSVRRWLATNPPRERVVDYEAWRREANANLAEGELPLPAYMTMWLELPIVWADRKRVARGEMEPEEARLAKTSRQADFTRGPHEFVSIPWIARRQHLTMEQANRQSHRPEFPRSVLRLSRTRLWLREDVDAYAEGRAFPAREPGELQHLYLSSAETAELIGLRHASLRNPRTVIPEPAGRVGHHPYWLREEVEQWMREHPKRSSPLFRVSAARPRRQRG